MTIAIRLPLAAALALACAGASAATTPLTGGDDWPAYGHDPGGMRYSPLTQIDRGNVAQLTVAWTFHTGDITDGRHGTPRSGFETTPILVDGTLYLTTPFNRVVALDPETGKQRWVFDPHIDRSWPYGDGLINRGVATWLDAKASVTTGCRRRIYEATLDARLISLDAATGKPCADFGTDGQVNLDDVARYRRGWYHMTSPPAVVGDVVVVGSAIDDNVRADMPSGVVRGFDARSGALRWRWDPIPPNADAASGAKSWQSGAANAWSIMSVDPPRDLVFVPTGSASPDYYGGLRPGDDRWADSVVALRGSTGALVWGFQLVHHNLWDYDTAAPPLLATLHRGGHALPVVIAGNKTGMLYVLDRATGKPVFPVAERAVPQSDVPGETTAPTQPFPRTLPPLVPQQVSAKDAWGLTPADREACRKELAALGDGRIFTPPALKDGVAIPGIIGGINWSGYAFDPQRQLLIVNTSNLPFKMRVIPRAGFAEQAAHGERGDYTAQTGAPYGMYRAPLLSPSHLPCVAPPWGQLIALDLGSGRIRWHVPLGSMAPGNPAVPAGAPSLGGPIATAGGLVFVAGTILDPHFRAFDIATGKLLWQTQLPAVGHATPMTYRVRPGGRQFVVIAAGGSAKIDEEAQGDAVIAYALPEEHDK